MFVSIDMDALRFLHKHHDHETVSAVSWLECGQQVSIRVEPYHDRSMFLRNVSELDVRMLYKNTTGQALPRDADAMAVRYQLADVVQLMPTSRVLTHEVLAQVAAVDDRLHAGERFAYALGALTPAQPGELFPLKARPLTEQELATAHSHSRSPVKGYPPRLTGQVRKPWETEEPTIELKTDGADHTEAHEAQAEVYEQTTGVKMGKARTGSVQPVVFAAAKAAWEHPDRVAKGLTWEQVRAELVKKLEADGYHPTTIRIKLSKWAKENAI
jgi:hypothetical protein